MFAMVALLVAPLFLFKDLAEKSRNEGPQALLTAIAKSQAGDTEADALALRGLERATRSVVDGRERFRIDNGSSCWEIEPVTSDAPYRC